MSEDSQTKQSATRGIADATQVDFSKASKIIFYANHCGSQVTFFDILVSLSTVHVEGGKVVADQTIDLHISAEFALALKGVLDTSLQQYSNVYGEPRVPDPEKIKHFES